MILFDDTADTRSLLEMDAGVFRPAQESRAVSAVDLAAFRALGGGAGGTDPILAQRPGGFWRRMFLVDSAPASQFDALDRLLDQGAAPPAPAAALAVSGDGFHGHRGRGWAALRGNLHLSVLLTPDRLAARDALSIVMLPAVATADAIAAATAGKVHPGIKWVNDILIDGRKVAGVIAATRSEGELLTTAILGIGLNVECAPRIPPTPFVPAVTSLREQPGCHTLRLPDLLEPMLCALEHRIVQLLKSGPGPLLAAYRRLSVVRGREVRIYPEGIDDESPEEGWPPPLASGTVAAIGDDLSLRLEGRPQPVHRGRLAFTSPVRERTSNRAPNPNEHPTQLS